MDATLRELEQHTASGNVQAGLATLQTIKLARLTAGSSSDRSAPVSDAQYAAALECGILLDSELLSRHMPQLLPLYSQSDVQSTRQNHMIGLHLMDLLVRHHTSEFHAAVELLTDSQLIDPFIQFPLAIERQWMVGLYQDMAQPPHPSFQIWVDQLPVREAKADCLEVAYESLTVNQAAQLLDMSANELREYMEMERDDWIVQGDTITFQVSPSAAITQDEVPADDWIQRSLTYATELERIV